MDCEETERERQKGGTKKDSDDRERERRISRKEGQQKDG